MSGQETRLIQAIITTRLPTRAELDNLSENALQSLRRSAHHAFTDRCSYPSQNDPERIRFQNIYAMACQELNSRYGHDF